MLSIRNPLYIHRDTYRLKVKWQKKTCNANIDQKEMGATLLISDRADFRTWEKDEHYIMLKSSILQHHIKILNVCMPKYRTSKYVRQKTDTNARRLIHYYS